MLTRALVVALAFSIGTAHAQPTPDPDTTLAAFPEPALRLRRSTAIATAEVLTINGVFWLVSFSIGKPYARISYDSVMQNLKSDWVWDEDAFATNLFGHPYLGALMYNGARSNGFTMLGASVFSFAGSAFWELFMETETPSINDQIFTPFGGILFGEVMHRYGRAMLWNGGARPKVGRLVLSSIVDPIGSFTGSALGKSWTNPQPPAMFGYVSAGWSTVSSSFGTGKETIVESYPSRVHASIALSYGLPLHDSFTPRRPMDHFEFLAEGDVSPKDAYFSVHTQGLLFGGTIAVGGVHAVGGLFGGYDFESQKRIRVGAASLGLGGALHVGFGERNFLQGTAVVGAIPFGAAGGEVREAPAGVATERDYHRGWGLQQTAIARFGRRGLGMLYATTRNFFVDGAYFDEGSELISFTRVGGMAAVLGRHGFSIEGEFGLRRGDFGAKVRDTLDSSLQLRISYVLMQDLTFGGGAAAAD